MLNYDYTTTIFKGIALPATVPNEAQGDWEQVKAAMEA
jgi:hypothetical protein